MDIVTCTFGKIGEILAEPVGRQVGRHVGYLIHWNKNIKDLRDQLKRLENVRKDTQKTIDAAVRNGDEIRNEVKDWIETVDGFHAKAAKFLDDDVNAEKRCFYGWFPKLVTLYRLGKGSKKQTLKAIELQNNGRFGNTVSNPAPPLRMEAIPSKNYVTYETRNVAFKEVMDALKDNNINFIEIHGMGGVGKTSLVKEIGKKAEQEKLFDEVVMAVVSQTVDVKKIQDEIAGMLGLKLDKKNDDRQRSMKLYTRIKGVKRILIILDDVWGKLDLEDVGIPFGNDHNGCKIVITTRRHQVCRTMGMGNETTKIVHLDVLSEPESWDLFRKNVGDVVDSSELKEIAKEVAQRCRGLPIALVTVGRSMRGKQAADKWQMAAEELKKSDSKNIEDLDEHVYRCLKLSYEYLRDEEAKSCVLLCSMFPEDYDILVETLVRYIVGLDKSASSNLITVQEARRRVNSVVENLREASLLVDSGLGKEGTYIKMHDVVRQVAISIASDKYLVGAGGDLKQVPDNETLKGYSGISLIDNKLISDSSRAAELQASGVKLPNLQILLLQNSGNFWLSFSQFFRGMEGLRVLDMSEAFIITVPIISYFRTGLGNLKNLQTLILDQVICLDNTFLRNMKVLKVLSLKCSYFLKTPKEIRLLSNLRLLDMTLCRRLRTTLNSHRETFGWLPEIPLSSAPPIPNVLSSLSRLEELYLLGTEITDPQIIASLKYLRFLTVLTISIKDPKLVPEGFVFPELETFVIFIGNLLNEGQVNSDSSDDDDDLVLLDSKSVQKWLESKPKPNFLGLKDLAEVGPLIRWRNCIKMILKRTNELHIARSVNINNIVPSLSSSDGDGLKVLKTLKVINCLEFEYLIDTSEEQLGTPFLSQAQQQMLSNLEELHLKNLDRFKGICTIALPSEGLIFSRLRILEVAFCLSLKYLFQPCMAPSLHQLQKLEVSDCQELDEIVANENIGQGEERAIDKIVFRSLKALNLRMLPNLNGFCTGSFPFEWPSLEEVFLEGCPKMKTFVATTSRTQSMPKLKAIKVNDDEIVVKGDLNKVVQEYCFKAKGLSSK